MGFRCGIVGLPNAGKSTLFNALARAQVAVASYPFCTIEPNVGTVPVPDARLTRLAELFRPQRVIPATLRFVDVAGLVRGASRGEGLGNQFLGHLREVDALAHVVRCFRSPEVAHVEGELDPVRDAEIVDTELALADLELVERRLDKVRRQYRLAGETERREEVERLERLVEGLNRGEPARDLLDSPFGSDLPLLTAKPVVYVANVGEEDLPEGGEAARRLAAYAARRKCAVLVLCARLEAELAELDEEERRAFMKEYGLERSGLEELVRAGYRLLGLITFFTVDGPEVRAWTVPEGTVAVRAAGKIHSDFERGFISAEVIPWDTLVDCGGLARARELGLVRLEGRDYRVQDGDVIHFRFNV
ncbi:MAG: redox-regulated ATPase YchF [Moorellales bacterium]